MRALILALVISLLPAAASAKVNTVVSVAQEQNQWCWAGVSRSALLYFGVDKRQCEIAEWTRVNNTASDRNFGSTDCCANPSGACNNWNYFWDSGGSIDEIVQHFAPITTVQHDLPSGTLSLTQVSATVDAGKLFFFRWERTDGSGHFLLGHGYTGTLLHYMDPWPGEGLKVAEHTWVVSGGGHRWTSTLVASGQTACGGKADGATCDDGNACTTGDRCTAGACAGTAVSCAGASACVTGGTCNPATGQCAGGTNKPDGTTCEDGNLCTTGDRCQAGACQGTARSCAAADACSQGGTCDPATGSCTGGAPRADGTTCDDGDPCTSSDRCRGGACQGTARTCAASDACHLAGTCDPSSGTCSSPTAADGTACAGGTCAAGVCTASPTTPTPTPPPQPVMVSCSSAGAGLAWPLALLGLLSLRRRRG